MSNYTPGPWYATEGTPYVTADWGNQKIPIGQVIRPAWHEDKNCASIEAFKNAQLMAAAPELYEALTDVLDGVGFLGGGDHELEGFGISKERGAEIRKTLAKARGEGT